MVLWKGSLFFVDSVGKSPDHPEWALYKWKDQRAALVARGIRGLVNVLLATPDGILVGGSFTNYGNSLARNLAKWNGQEWSAVGETNEVPGKVEAMARDRSGHTYLAGSFKTPRQTRANVILEGDGHRWEPLGGGLLFQDYTAVRGLVVTPAGEVFLGLGVWAKPAFYELLLRWDGSRWHRLGSVKAVQALAATPSGKVFCAGVFGDDSPAKGRHLAVWDGAEWLPLNGDLGHPAPRASVWVSAMCAWNEDLVAAGSFLRAGDRDCRLIAKFDGSIWSPLGGGLGGGGQVMWDGSNSSGFWESGGPRCLVPFGKELLAFGTFTRAGEVGVQGAARWDGTRWHPLVEEATSQVSGLISALATDGHSVVAAGPFTAAGQVTANGLARWEGDTWKGFGGETPVGPCERLAGAPGKVWAGTVRAGRPDAALLEWDGHQMQRLLGLTRSPFPALVSDGKTLFVGDQALQSWDGEKTAVLANLPGRGLIGFSALALRSDGGIYAAFRRNGGSDSLVQLWNGLVWQDLRKEPVGFSVNALQETPVGLYAGGEFLSYQAMKNIGLWDGTQWRTLGSGIQTAGQFPLNHAIVWALAYTNGVLYVGGRFTHAGGTLAHNIAAWDGHRWSALGDGVRGSPGMTGGEVRALAILGDHLYVGGDFHEAGGKPAINFARWRLR